MNKSDQTKEKILRRLLESSACFKGRGAVDAMALLERLADLYEKNGDAVGSVALRTEYAVVDLDAPGSAVYLNILALAWRQAGRPYEAELLLRQALEIESRVLPPDACEHPHRLNNLSTVLIMKGELGEAKQLLRRAWELMKDRHDLTSVRILLSRLSISLLESKPPGIYIGRLKTLLLNNELGAAGNITVTTRAAVMIDYLGNRLLKKDAEFLHALFRVANCEEEADSLKRFDLWRKFAPATLDLSVPAASLARE